MRRILTILAACMAAAALAGEPQPPKLEVIEGSQTSARAAVRLEEMRWLAGQWVGKGFGGTVEEVWTPAAAGSMMGSYRLIKDGKIVFMEICTLTERDGNVVLRVKHFAPDLVGWEEKAEVQEFPLLKRDGDRFYFDGVTFGRDGNDTLSVVVRIHERKKGTVRDELMQYKRLSTLAAAQ